MGKGTWYFKNGNTLEGEFDQKEKVINEDEEPAEDVDPDAPKPKELLWQSATNIAESAHHVNSVEQ